MSYITKQILTTSLNIKPNEIHKDIDTLIQRKLIGNVEGLCYEDGYIINGSVRILKRNMGKIVTYDNQSATRYNITYEASVISPSDGEIIDVYVSNINKMGVISYIKLDSDKTITSQTSPMIIIIPQNYFEESVLNIEDINVGQTLKVQILGSRIKFRSDKIQCVAKPVS